MNKFRKTLQILTGMTLAVLCGCTKTTMPKTTVKKGTSVTIIEATDLHYLSPSLHDDGEQFQATMKAGDGKMAEYSDQILDKLIDDAIEKKADALVLSGDITFNGEKISLQEVADKLKRLEDAGIPVVAIPGNHDIDYPFAYQYTGKNVKPVEGIETSDFETIMKDYGWSEAVSRAPDSMSYTYPLADDVVLMMLDANTKDDPGTITDKTMQWMEEQLKWAEDNNIQIIAVSHQNILKQSPLLYEGFVVSNYKDVSALLEKYHVSLVLSGHSHLQHTSTENGLTDICTESLAVYPLQYGIVTIDGNNRSKFTYRNQSLNILQDESLKRFDAIGEGQLANQFAEMDTQIPESTKQEMISFARRLNRLYFTGHMDEAGDYKSDPAWKDWETYASDSFFFNYMQSMDDAE